MQVKIKNKGKVKEFKLIKNWNDVTLENWTKLIQHKTNNKSSEALTLISELSNIPKDIINKLELSDVATIMGQIGKLQSEADTKLSKIVEIDNKRYGFHPDLDSITLGEYADIETFIKLDVEKHLPEIMAILYRPILDEKNGVYTIEAYDGEIKLRTEEMKKMSAQQVQNALVFFWNFGKIFVKTLQSSLITKLKETNEQLQPKASAKNGLGLA
tara:strand:- start:143 stop:784 length:642 start_codon:yes stop_codon:yes gene_type:complete